MSFTRRRLSIRSREAIGFYLCILPWIIGFLAFVAGPILSALWMSFTDWDILTPPSFIGLRNYVTLARANLFWTSLRVTTIYAASSVVLVMLTALLVALLMNQRIRGILVFRTIYYLPAVVTGVTVSVMWKWMLNPDYGIVNHILRAVGITGPGWLFSSRWALPSLIFMSMWQAGSYMVIFLAGLHGIPTALYDVATMDGAGTVRKFLSITLPMLSPVILLNMIISIISYFQAFTQAYVMTGGGPNNATLFYVLYVYRQGWSYFKMGYASALAWILFAIILGITVLVLRTSSFWVYYAGERS
jgi:multiple sugar transport system permease protein